MVPHPPIGARQLLGDGRGAGASAESPPHPTPPSPPPVPRGPGRLSITTAALKGNLHYSMAEGEEERKSLLMKVKEQSEKVGLQLNIQKAKIMASGPITSWQIDGETVETVADFIIGGSKITADGDCSHEIKRCLLLGREVMINLDSMFKSRDITLPSEVHLVKAMVFPIVVYGCESWTINKAERQRIEAFELWFWRGLESPLGCKEIQPVHPKGNRS